MSTGTETTTPAVELAKHLCAIADHLRAHPHLPRVNYGQVRQDFYAAAGLQISSFPSRGEVSDAAAVLLWAKSMPNATIEVRKHGAELTEIWVSGNLGGFKFQVWDTDHGDIRRWCSDDKHQTVEIDLQQLTDYVAFGTVGVA